MSSFKPVSVYAQQEEEIKDEALKKGVYLFRQENYDEAVKVFQDAVQKQPDSSLASYYLGLTYKRMENYVEAKKYLLQSLNLKPKIVGALIELIDLLYRIDEYDEAKKWIKIAEDEGIRPAQSKFLKGLTCQKSGEYEEAVQAFKDAADLDDRLKQSANYQIGVCYLRMKNLDQAKDIFKEAFALDPNSEIGNYANRYIDAIDRKQEVQRPFHFSARTAFEYDSNVVLQPDNTAVITGVSDKDDTREVYDIKGDYTFRTEDNFASLKTGYNFHVSKENDLGRYDVVANSFNAQGNLSYEKVLVTFPVNYNHNIVDDKNYLSTVTAGNVDNIMVTTTQMAQIGALYKYNDYLRAPFIEDEGRSGNELFAIAGWYWFFNQNKGFVNIRYTMDRNWADGTNWEYWGHKVGLGVLYPITDKFKASIMNEIFFQDFDNKNTLFDKYRTDQTYSICPGISYEVMKNFEIQFNYTYVNERSTVNIYQYDRHVVSIGAEFKY